MALSKNEILNPDPEEVFDDLVTLAAQICATPMALIHLLDSSHHWWKAKVGLETTEVALSAEFCKYTILQSDVLIVPDASQDKRFANHSVVTSPPHIRFYAGIALNTDEGKPLGTLCVLDYIPRDLNPKQVEGLQALGRQAIAQLQLRCNLAFMHDMTECRRIEEVLRKAKDELEIRVAERTAELISVNAQLQSELDERLRTQEALRVSQARFAGILDIADDAIISINTNQCITLFNQGAEKIFGYTAAEVIGQPLDMLLPPRYTLAHHQHVVDFGTSSSKARQMGERREIFARRKDGVEFPAEASISKLELREEIIFTVILRDITVNKQAREALERMSRQNELILNSMGEGLCGLDKSGKIVFVNPAAAKLLGYQVVELIGQSIDIILTHSKSDSTYHPLTDCPLHESLWDTSVHSREIHGAFRRKNNSSFPVEYVSTPIQEQGVVKGFVVTFKDITDRQIVERMKDEFISVVSHELRTPLTSIHGSLGMLKSGLLDPNSDRGKRLLEIAVDSTDRLVRLINDILDIERIESGKIAMEKRICDAADLMTETVDVMQAMAQLYGVKLSVSPISVRLWADPDRIIQTLTNLLSNAIKFSPQGGTVWLTAERQGDQILFQVKDQGRGIPSDKLESIFERFQQVDVSDSRNHEGTGLGLAICRSIVRQHSGHIWVKSQLGEGSTFYFTLPIRIPHNREQEGGER